MIGYILFIEILNALYQLKDTHNTIQMTSQAQAYDKYTNAKTDGTKISLHDPRALHPDFVEFIDRYTPPLNNPVVTKQEFLEDVLHRTFHLYWAANLTPPGFGVGNPATLTFRRNPVSGDYDISYFTLTDNKQTQSFDPSYYILHSNSLQLQDSSSGKLKQMILKRTPQTTVNGVPVWNHQLVVDGRLIYNYYLVDFQL